MVAKIKEEYPKGTRICLEHMEDDYPVEDGTMGTVDHVDDIGSIFMIWDNGRSLAIIPNADKFHITEMPRLFIGHHSDGSEEICNTYEMAKFIVEKGQTGDLLVTDEQGTPFLNTFSLDRSEEDDHIPDHQPHRARQGIPNQNTSQCRLRAVLRGMERSEQRTDHRGVILSANLRKTNVCVMGDNVIAYNNYLLVILK